jgi:hypothetical protein
VKQTQSVKNQKRSSRRSFLRKGAIAGGSVAEATTLSGEVLAAEEIPDTETKSDSYRMTDHIAEYYKTAKL